MFATLKAFRFWILKFTSKKPLLRRHLKEVRGTFDKSKSNLGAVTGTPTVVTEWRFSALALVPEMPIRRQHVTAEIRTLLPMAPNLERACCASPLDPTD